MLAVVHLEVPCQQEITVLAKYLLTAQGRPCSKELIVYNCTARFVCRLVTSHRPAEQSLSGHY